MIIMRNICSNNNIHFACKFYAGFFLIGFLFLAGGCAEIKKINSNGKAENAVEERIGDVKIEKFLLSPGDKINISVYKHDDLTRTIKIPPGGQFYYPIVGEVTATGKSLRELREIIVNGLSEYKKQSLIPGDEISITVYQHNELSRKLIIPPDGYFFFPLVGEIDTKGRNPREIRIIISKGLDEFIVDPQVAVDIVNLSNPKMIVAPEVGIEVVEFGGHKVFVLGEVKRPGVYLADGNMRIIEAILLASGLTLDAKQKSVLLIRGGIDKRNPKLIVVNLKKAFEEGDANQNILVQQGDIIYVPRTFISDVNRFFSHLSTIISPILQLETGYFVGQQIHERHRGGTSGSSVIAP